MVIWGLPSALARNLIRLNFVLTPGRTIRHSLGVKLGSRFQCTSLENIYPIEYVTVTSGDLR